MILQFAQKGYLSISEYEPKKYRLYKVKSPKGEERMFRNAYKILFEDISCLVMDTDAAGLEIAKSLQSRLPENQMKLRTENATLLLSKAKYGEFDMILVSREAYDAYGAQVIGKEPFVETIEAEGVKE